MRDKYSDPNKLATFGFMANMLDKHTPDGDTGASFPRSDAEDLSRGLRFIPGEVTLARRRGERVDFIQDCDSPLCWYWQFQDDSRTHYWERPAFEQHEAEHGTDQPCPSCGNPHIRGGKIAPPQLDK